MPRYDIACLNGHLTEVIRASADRYDPCPTCGSAVELRWVARPPGVIRDEIPGGMVFENGLERPTRFYSHSEHRAALAARGKEIAAKHAGPHDKICARWATMDAKTLENAQILVSRRTNSPSGDDGEYPPAAADAEITRSTKYPDIPSAL